MIQGFLIESDAEIRQLQQCCRSVVIDRRRSVGDQFAEFPREKATTRFTAASSALQFAVEVLDAGFAAGDELIFEGPTTGFFRQVAASLRLEEQVLERAGAGEKITLPVGRQVRAGDKVYLLK